MKKGKWLEVARSNGIKDSTFYSRIKRGYSQEKAATTVVEKISVFK